MREAQGRAACQTRLAEGLTCLSVRMPRQLIASAVSVQFLRAASPFDVRFFLTKRALWYQTR